VVDGKNEAAEIGFARDDDRPEFAALEDQLIEWVISKAKVTDKPASFAELTGFGKTPQ